MVKHLRLIFALVFSIFFSKLSLHAEGITNVNLDQQLVYIDKGIVAGYEEGVRVCFLSQKKVIACGKILKATLYKAQVFVEDNLSELEAIFRDHPDLIQVRRPKAQKNPPTISPNKHITSTAFPSDTSEKPAEPPSAAIRILWLPTLGMFTSASSNTLEYDGAVSAKNEPLWFGTSDPSELVVLGFGGEIVLASPAISAGFSYKLYPTRESYSIYDNPTTGTQDLFNVADGSEYSVYADYNYYLLPQLSIGAGLAYSAAQITFSATRQESLGTEADLLIYDYVGSTSLISLHVPVRYALQLNERFALSFGASATVRLVELAPSHDPYGEDPLNGTKALDPAADLQDALAFTSNPFSMEIALGAQVSL
jgi:hypothetical protein